MSELPLMSKEDFVYSRMGMALMSAQRVEFITGQLLVLLVEFDKDVYGITTEEFLTQSSKSGKGHKTLGAIFKLLKLNPKLVIETELNDFLQKRNVFVHSFWQTYLTDKSDETVKKAIDFCYDFGRHAERIENFFKGFVYFLSLRHVEDASQLAPGIKIWEKEFQNFLYSK